ncbi:unnamed protein product [Callosobruchus maculatus]|uniref:Uncharacterized protein n=1 Tax=Callosobruchus maculatus TaxID=64391 RepID=A0A653BJU0_CALMS|nr:unnamed protein product [Callosobruchus maculatus]
MASSPASSGPRSSPSVTSLTSVLRASPSMHQQSPGSRSSSPAMQSTSAGLNVTMGGATPSFSPLATSSGPPAPPTSWHPTSSAPAPGWQPTYTRPTYASTNPFLTGAYMSYTPGGGGASSGGGGAGGEDKFNTIGSTKEVKSFFESYAATVEASRYSTMNSKSTSNYNNEADTNGKVSFLSTGFTMDSKYSPKNSYDTSPNITTVSNSSSTGLLNVEETPTPTSSIETEDSATREVGEKDVEGDGEQSD